MSTPRRSSSTPAELRAEIASTRAAITADLDALSERLSRKRLMEDARHGLQGVAVPAVAAALLVGLVLGYAAGARKKRPRQRWSYAI